MIVKAKGLPNSTKVRLRRNFGRDETEIPAMDKIVAYSIMPENAFPDERIKALFCMGLELRNEDVQTAPLPDILATQIAREASEGSTSTLNKVSLLLDCKISEWNEFRNRLYSLLRVLESKDLYASGPHLYVDLLGWGSPSRYVQDRWERKITNALSHVEVNN